MKGHIIVWRMLHITLVFGYSYVFTTLLMYLLFIRGSSLLHSNPLFCYLQNDAPMRGVVNLVSQLCSTWSCLIVLMGDSKEAPIPCPFSLAMMVLFFYEKFTAFDFRFLCKQHRLVLLFISTCSIGKRVRFLYSINSNRFRCLSHSNGDFSILTFISISSIYIWSCFEPKFLPLDLSFAC